MTIDELLIHFDAQDIESQEMNNIDGKALVVFKRPYHWFDEQASIFQFLALFDSNTREIKAIKLYGPNLQSAEKYIKEHRQYFWNPVLHYMADYNSIAESLLLIMSF